MQHPKTYHSRKWRIYVGIVLIVMLGNLYAQDLSNIGKAPPLALNGGISLNQVYFHSDDTLATRDPYAYTMMANINLSVYGWSIPLSMIYSNRQWSYHQPFNQIAIHPSYKWIRLHLGYTSMTFSPYTLAGHQFLGAGVELTPPGKFSFSAMGGRLQKRILPDSANRYDPAYHRYGAGFKTEYSTGFGNIGVILFYARDNENSLTFEPDSIPVLPLENLCTGINGNFTFLRNFNFNFNYSLSTLTEDLYAPESESSKGFMPFYNYRESTRQYHAIRTSFNYNSRYGAIGVGFERVDPGYLTLGAYYSNSDFVNYTVNYTGGILNNRVTLAASYGLQQDNLSGQKEQENKRTVTNLNIGFVPVDKLNIAVFYSNFNNFTHIQSDFENINTTNPYGILDTLDFTQISENMGTSANLLLGDKEKISHSINTSFTFQKASQQQGDNPEHAGSKFYNASGGYHVRISAIDLSPGIMLNYSSSKADSITTEIIGPSLSLKKSFLDKKLNARIMLSYNKSLINKESQGNNTIARASAGYSIAKKHTFDLSIISAWRKSSTIGQRNELTVTFSYRYNFGWTPGKKNETKNE